MKFDRQKAFPYPVLRPNSDDYKDAEFQASIDFVIAGSEIKALISFAISCPEILNQIELGNAEYVCVISCRDTYAQTVVSSLEKKTEVSFPTGSLRGEVRVDPYIAVKAQITGYQCTDINAEFGAGSFSFDVGDVLAQDQTQMFFLDRDLFRPLTSVFDLAKDDDIVDGTWKIDFSCDHVQIKVNQRMKESLDNARNDGKNRIILKNSIYFAAVMQAIQKIQDPDEDVKGKKWAEIIEKQASNKGIDISKKDHDAYFVAEQLMQFPMLQLVNHVFKGDHA